LHTVGELIRRVLLDADDDLAIHNWHGRQKVSDDVTERVRKHRSGPTNSETLHETEVKRSGNGLDKSREEENREDTEKRRVEKKTRATNATLFPDKFDPPYEWAASELGMTVAIVDAQVPKMRDWSHSKGETRKDWIAFARNWLRKECEKPSSRASPNGQPSNYFEAVAKGHRTP
jgi:hypothetical protein